MIWWFHIVIKSSWNILSSIVHKSSKQIENASSDRLEEVTTATRLAQLGEHRSAEKEVVGSNPGRTDNQGVIYLSSITHYSYHGLWVGHNKLIN